MKVFGRDAYSLAVMRAINGRLTKIEHNQRKIMDAIQSAAAAEQANTDAVKAALTNISTGITGLQTTITSLQAQIAALQSGGSLSADDQTAVDAMLADSQSAVTQVQQIAAALTPTPAPAKS